MADTNPTGTEQTADNQRQLRVHVDERDRQTTYTNSFRSNATAEEVILDFGLNVGVQRGAQSQGEDAKVADMVFQVSNRMVMNFYTAKRLALSLGQMVQQHEQQFGELKLNVADRTVGDANA